MQLLISSPVIQVRFKNEKSLLAYAEENILD